MRLIAAVVALALANTPALAVTYEERFLQDIRLVITPTEPTVPDDVENAFWQCWGRAFLATQVSSNDRAALDKLAAGKWNPKDPLIVKYHDRVQEAFNNPDGVVAKQVSGRMPLICRADFDAFLAALED